MWKTSRRNFTLRTSDDKLTRLPVVDRPRPFINDDDDV